MCGTAITVERITAEGVWQGGAIAPGLGQTARALHLMTAQLPFIELSQDAAGLGARHRRSRSRPASSGGSSAPSASCWPARRRPRRRSLGRLDRRRRRAARPPIFGDDARIEPNLILGALAEVAFGESAGSRPSELTFRGSGGFG